MKGQDVLLRAFSILTVKHPQWSVRLVGPEEDRTFKKELLSYVECHDLKGKVSFLGSLEERMIDEEYARATIFCLPSVSFENAGQVKYEATASGLPVVTTDVPCRRDSLDAGWVVVPAGDAESLARQLDILMSDEASRLVKVEHAQSHLNSYESIALLYISLLDLPMPKTTMRFNGK
jgi:glycosyltransferase involved in cell wall biosynthesis